ncbi:hypothetical protein LOAG_02688 [Loa loa]|uniref:Uncharacterized protein n=1 Tax=Loa loa TaxID=7209 RepID=A0A1I7VD62_LOALO|nr:hypothetical protein LOAG_02688 [Loa loa]EFO25793.2 hypothetical protein LOAG_02688 [Loa loa]
MRSDEDDIVPSTSTLLFPDLLTRDELVTILKHKFKRIGVNTSKIIKLTNDELLEQFKKFAMPKPQRKACISRNGLNNFENIKDSNNSEEVENSGSVCSKVNAINGQRTTVYRKRCNTSSTEHHSAVKNSRKHSPIRFP